MGVLRHDGSGVRARLELLAEHLKAFSQLFTVLVGHQGFFLRPVVLVLGAVDFDLKVLECR
jgi:hypothetical protein